MAMTGDSAVGYNKPGDVDVRSFTLVSSSGQVIEIEDLVLDFSIFQNLFEHYMTCEIVINDSVGLINTLKGDPDSNVQGGFGGLELLCISYRSNSDDLEWKNHIFSLYELSDRSKIAERSEAYILTGISIEAVTNASQKVHKSFGSGGGNKISNMISSVMKEHFYNPVINGLYYDLRTVCGFQVSKPPTIDETTGAHRYIIPNLSVDDTIDFFADESDSDDHIPYYVFYENSHGFNYRNIGSLVQQEVKETFTYAIMNSDTAVGDAEKNYDRNKIMSFNVIKQANFLDNIEQGLYKTQSTHIDLLKKTKRVTNFDYEKHFDKFKTLQSLKIAGLIEKPSISRLFTSDHGRDRDMKFALESPLPKTLTETAGHTAAYSTHIFNTMMEVTVPGDSEIDVGDVIYLTIPPSAITEDQEDGEDKYLSGKYIVTKVRQKMLGNNGDTSTTIMECGKDTGIKV
tara:strand:+ start:488 stop:1858 length:1371 start_codon:yes stop_codon:yes gene_type:complete